MTIKREDLFIDLANKFPPVVLVDLLYLMKVSTFDEAVYQDILDKYETTYCKLNYPKFYIDKNINILLLPSSISDYRMVSSMATSSISFVMSDLEFSLMNVVGIRSKNDYSRLQSFLKEIGMPNDLRLDVVVLRNFAMHGYVFGEYIVFDDMSYQFTLDFLIKTLERLLLFCKDYNEKLFQVLTRAISDRVVNKFVAAKYRKAIETTKQYVQEGPSIELKKALFVKNEFIRHSFYDVRDLNKLNSLSLDEPIVLEVKVKDTNDYFYFYSQTDEQKALLNEFLRQNNYRIKKEIRDGVVTEIYVE